MANWAYFQRTRDNYEEIFDAPSKLIFWFGGQLKSVNEISYYESRGKSLLHMQKDASSTLEDQIFNLILTDSYDEDQTIIIRKNIRMEVFRAHAILKLLEAFTPSRRVIDIGAGCGIVNYVFQHTQLELKSVVSCDQIEFSRNSFLELNNALPEEKKTFLYQDELFKYADYNEFDVLLFRWSFDEFDDDSKARTVDLITKKKFQNILVCGTKHSNTKVDIDYELVSLGYVPVFCGRKPFDHGFVRLYERQDERCKRLYRVLSFMRLFPGKKNKWFESIVSSFANN